MTEKRKAEYFSRLGEIEIGRKNFAQKIGESEDSLEVRRIIGDLKNSVCGWHGSAITALAVEAKKDSELTDSECEEFLRGLGQYKLEKVGRVFFTDKQIKKVIKDRQRKV